MGNCSTQQTKDKLNRYNQTIETVPKKIEYRQPLHDGPILSIVRLSHKYMALCSEDKRLSVVDREKVMNDVDYRPKYFLGHTKAVNRVVLLDQMLWSASRDRSIRQWDVQTGEMKQTIADTHSLNVTSIAAHPSNAGTIFTGSRDYSVKGWDIETALCKCEYKAERNIVTVMEFDPVDPNLLYQGSEDLSVRVWDIRQSSQQPAFHMTGYVYFPLCMDIHKDGFMMATGCRGFNFVGCEVKLWDLRNTSKFLSEFKGHGQDVNSCKFLHDDKVLLSASKDGSVIAWDIHSLHRKSSKSVAASSITGKELPYTDSKESMSSKNSDNTRTNFAQVQTSGKNITSMAVFDAIPGKFSNDSTGTSNKYTTASKKIPVALSTTDGSLVFLSMDLSGDDGERSGHKVNAGFEVELVTPEYYDVESENASINVTQG